MPIYPEKVTSLASAGSSSGRLEAPSATGTAVSFECGSLIGFDILIESDLVVKIGFFTNGCGYMTAAGSLLSKRLKGCSLVELHGLEVGELLRSAEAQMGPVSPERVQCLQIAIGALKASFAKLRAGKLTDHQGDEALVCSCFGVSEAAITKEIDARGADSVMAVTKATRAGGGCGSCRMLIQELLDDAPNRPSGVVI